MISSKKLIKMVRKWKKLAAISRKRITLGSAVVSDIRDMSKIDRGYFVVCTVDRKRVQFPLVYLDSQIFKELLKMAEEEFGHHCDGPITLPCDSVFMVYAVSLIKRQIDDSLEKALLMSKTTNRCSLSSYLQHGLDNQQLLICSF